MSPDSADLSLPGGLSAAEATELGRDLAEAHRDLAVRAAVGRAGVARADRLAAATGHHTGPARPRPQLPAPARVSGWGWRQAVRFAITRRMYTPDYLLLYARYLAQRLRHPHVGYDGLVFFGPRVALEVRRWHGRLRIGAWCWIGEGSRLRCHEGNLRLGPKVVMGRDNTLNAYLEIELGRDVLMSDSIYICDFDHRYERPDVPIRKQGLVKTPVRVGEDVWIGEKASILRGADIGAGSVIGSQALVKGHIPPFSIAVGSPARVIGSRLPAGMTVAEALDRQRRGAPIPGDPLDD